jgi:hypothetical protein
MKKKGQMPPWFGGLAEMQARLKRERQARKLGRASVAAEAAQNQSSVMAMRGR